MSKNEESKPPVLMNQKDYFKHRKEHGLIGGTQAAVSMALRDHRIAYTADGMIDAQQADRAWAENTVARPNLKSAHGDYGYAEARAERERLEASLASVKLQQIRGGLISADVVRKVLFAAGRAFRAALEDVTCQLAPDLAVESDISNTERILKKRFDDLLKGMTSRIEKLDASLFKSHGEGGQEVGDA